MKTVVWRGVGLRSMEHFTLQHTKTGYQLAGRVVAVLTDQPTLVQYRVECDPSWRTLRVQVDQWWGDEHKELILQTDDQQCWWRGRQEITTLRGCVDIDLGISPSTNTLPVKRLSLAVNESKDLMAAWISFPLLDTAPLPQRYTRLDDTHYRYMSSGGRFQSDIELDELGLVVNYPQGWERMA